MPGEGDRLLGTQGRALLLRDAAARRGALRRRPEAIDRELPVALGSFRAPAKSEKRKCGACRSGSSADRYVTTEGASLRKDGETWSARIEDPVSGNATGASRIGSPMRPTMSPGRGAVDRRRRKTARTVLVGAKRTERHHPFLEEVVPLGLVPYLQT